MNIHPMPDAQVPPAVEPCSVKTTVSVVIPTIDRYAILKSLLGDLTTQTEPPLEVIVVDQSPRNTFDMDFYAQFRGKLPLKVLVCSEERGTCVARNLGADFATGSHLLFLDDDVRCEADLIEQYGRIVRQGWDVVHGGVRWKENPLLEARYMIDDPLLDLTASPNTTKTGMCIGLPGGNCLVSQEWFRSLGGFDRRYDDGPMDDRDFGMRLFRGGALMVYHPRSAVKHLKAATGGRRDWEAARSPVWGSFWRYHPTELAPLMYFCRRHFTVKAARLLLGTKLLEILWPEYRLLRYPWMIPVTLWWFTVSVLRSARMARNGPVLMGTYPPPKVEVLVVQ